MILADSSVWIDHIRRPDPILSARLLDGEIVGHAFVSGEISLGSIADRSVVVAELGRLVQLPIATPTEVALLIENEELWGTGVGYVDAHLLASCRLAPGSSLWTRDKRLRTEAERIGVAAP
jgi:predicted nucleic acid-binding protein